MTKEGPMSFIKSDIYEKVLAIIAFSFIILLLIIIIKTPPAFNYEISMYGAYPWYFWFLMLATVFIGQLIIFKVIFYKSSEKQYKGLLLGVIAILIPIIILLVLPIIRGYPTYGRGDHLSHIGEIKDIIQFGNIGQDNFYPNSHILTASSILVTGSGVITIVNFITRFFFILSPISIYLFFKIIFRKKNEMELALIFATSFLFFGTLCNYFAPFYQSFLLMLIILYLYFKRGSLKDNISFSILFIIIFISINFYHPLNSLLLIFILLFLAIVLYLSPKIKRVNLIEVPEKPLKEKSFNIVLFSTLVFFTWYFSFSSIVGSFYHVFSSIFYGTGGSFFESQVTAVVSYSPKLFDTLKMIVYNYGLLLIIDSLSLFSLIYVFIMRQRNKQSYKLRFCFVFSGIFFLVFSVLLAGSIFTDFIVGWNRFMLWLTIFSIILITSAFYSLLSDSKKRNTVNKPFKKLVTTTTVYVILISLTFLSIFTFYNSPLTGDQNLQVSNTEWEGAEWIINYNDKQILIEDLGIFQGRFYSAILGIKEYNLIKPVGGIFKSPPDHFNYNNKTSLGEYYNGSRYMILTHLIKIIYPEVYPEYKRLWRFTPDDFNQLQNDNAVSRLYDNGGFEAYLVKSSRV